MKPEPGLPPAIAAPLDHTLADYWRDRATQHFDDSYAGIPISKFPEDLRVYEHLIWQSKANVVLEIGAQAGGSAAWFRDRLMTLNSYRGVTTIKVISIDVSVSPARANLAAADPGFAETIELVEGDVLDASLPSRIEPLIPPGSACLVVEDSAHTYETTRAALQGFSRFVPPQGFFVVEDGCVDVEEMRLRDDWPRGVLPAIADWLTTPHGSRFDVRRDLELYGISCHPGGFLQRVSAAPD